MPSLDAKVASVLDRDRGPSEDEDEDDLIAELERDEDSHGLSGFREQRLQQLHAEYTRAQTLKAQPGHGAYQEIKDEKQIMDITTSTKLCVVHFMKPDFARCRVMDQRLGVLAERHFETRFVGVNVDNAPFLVVKLGIKVLPCVIAFVDGVGVDRIVGFEGVGKRMGVDGITAGELEERLVGSGVLVRAKIGEEEGVERKRRERMEEREEEDDGDDDWD